MSLTGNKKSFFYRLIFSKFFLILASLLLLFLVATLVKKMAQDYGIEREVEELKSEIAELERQSNEFTELVDYLNSEQFLEEEARMKLGFGKPGESVIVINNEEEDEQERANDTLQLNVYSKTLSQSKEAKQEKNYVLWWNYFFSKK